MHLARHSITPTHPIHILSVRFDSECKIFTVSTPTGWAVYRAWPLALLRKRDLPNGTLAQIVPLHATSLLYLVGGGLNPLYPPNKVILWDDSLSREVAELEFREKVRGLACRRGWLAVALKRRVVVFEVRGATPSNSSSSASEKGKGVETDGGETGLIRRSREWETCVNEKGLLALATEPDSTLLVIPGRLRGHVQLIRLPPCPAPPPPSSLPPPSSIPRARSPPHPQKPPPPQLSNSILLAHESSLSTLSVTSSGSLLSTTSDRGTLVRVWNTQSGKLVREFRRGSDQAEIYGVAFRKDEAELCVWSDKGTVHVFRLGEGAGSNKQSTLSPLAPFIRLPKYFASEWSYAQYRIPSPSAHISLTATLAPPSPAGPSEERAEDEKCVVGWIEVPKEGTDETESQLVALTYTGGWYRLSMPSGGASSSSTSDQLTSTSSSPPKSPLSSSPHPHASPLRTRTSSSPSAFPRQSLPPPSPRPTSSRLSTPVHAAVPLESRGRSSPVPIPRSAKGKERASDLSREGDRDRDRSVKEKDKESSSSRCKLQEFRRFGRWDGWA